MSLQAAVDTACTTCRKPITGRRSSMQTKCVRCVLRAAYAKDKAARQDRRETKQKLEAMKSLCELRQEAQAAFNAFIRARDRKAGYGCICCDAPLDWNSTKPGGAVDAGHFVSRGSAIELAFDERNVNAQRKNCNRPGGTTRAQFTAGMVRRHGAAVVAELEGPHDIPRLRHDDLRAIKHKYRTLARELTKEAA